MRNYSSFLGTLGIIAVCLMIGCQRGETTTNVSDQSAADGHDHDDGDHDGHDHDGHDDGDDHDHDGHGHDHSVGPKSFHAAIARLKEIQTQLDTAMQENDMEAAHAPLHDVGRLLNKLPELAADTDLAESDWEDVKAESERLFDAFGDVDGTFHNDEGQLEVYEKAKPKIDDGIAKLESKLALAGEAPEDHADHDHEAHDAHDDDDHGDHDTTTAITTMAITPMVITPTIMSAMTTATRITIMVTKIMLATKTVAFKLWSTVDQTLPQLRRPGALDGMITDVDRANFV